MANTQATPANGHLSVKDKDIEGFIEKVTDVSDRAITASKRAADRSVSFAKEYPIHTAIGMGVVGFVAGIITTKILK